MTAPSSAGVYAASGINWDTPPHPSYNLWGTGNVEEVLPGITVPLSADIVTAFMHIYAHDLIEIARVPDLVELAEYPKANIFGFFGGRWAVNIAWLGAYVATYQPEQQSDMLTQFVRGDAQATKSGVAENVARARRTRRIVERTWAASIGRARREEALVSKTRLGTLAARLDRESDQRLLLRIDRNIKLAGKIFVRHAQSSIGGGENLGLLTGMLNADCPGHPEEWTTALTSALQDVVSAEPVQGIWELSRVVRRSARLQEDFLHEDVAVLRAHLESPPDGAWLRYRAAHAAFIARFGFRGQREVDPSVPDWQEDPTFVLAAVRANLMLPPHKNPAGREARAVAARERLEQRIEARLTPARRKQFRRLLGQTQAYVRAREQTKANWVQVCRAFRPPLLELGRRFAARGLLADSSDIFYLRLDELRVAVAGNLDAVSARRAIAARRAEYVRLHDFALPLNFTLPVTLERLQHVAPVSAVTLAGHGVSPGRASGRARIILDAEAGDEARIEPGEILVAPYTDAPWTPLFWPAAGVVVERGGMLSHASTVAREFGIPAVVGVAQATERIKTGAFVTVDGSTGTVTVE